MMNQRSQYDLQTHSNKIQEAFWKSDARVRGWFTSNRIGKSTGATADGIWTCLGQHPYRKVPPPPVNCRVLNDGYQTGIQEISIPLWRKHVNPVDLRGGEWDKAYSVGERVLYFKNGSRVQFMSYNLEDFKSGTQKYEGVALDWFHFDEHGPMRVFDACLARVGRNPLKAIVTLTPVLGETWEHDEIYLKWQAGVPGYECFKGSIWDNIHNLNEAEVRAWLDSISDPRMRRIRERGDWVLIGGAVYAMWVDDIHFIPFNEDRVRKASKTVIIDTHPRKEEAVVWCGVDQDGGKFAYREYLGGDRPIALVADDIRRLSREYDEDIRRFIIDPHWGWPDKDTEKSRAGRYIDAKIPVEPGFRGRDTDLFFPMQDLLRVSPTLNRAGFEVMQTCPELRSQFRQNQYLPQTSAQVAKDKLQRRKEDDDLLVCAEYFIKSNPVYVGTAPPRVGKPHVNRTVRHIMSRGGRGPQIPIRGRG